MLSLLLVSAFPAAAQQKFACVNTDYVLRNVPDYANAQKRLDKYVEDWTKELSEKQSEIETSRSCAICSSSALVREATSTRRGPSCSNPSRTVSMQRLSASPRRRTMALFSTRPAAPPYFSPTRNSTSATMSSSHLAISPVPRTHHPKPTSRKRNPPIPKCVRATPTDAAVRCASLPI